MSDSVVVSQFMVRDVVEAKSWHPVSYVRQQMLKHSFSYIPLKKAEKWWLIPENSLAAYLRRGNTQSRKERLATRLVAVDEQHLPLLPAETVLPSDLISEIALTIGERPLLVIDAERNELIGILGASDIL